MWLRAPKNGQKLMGNWDYKLYIVELYHLEREMAQLPRHTCLLKEPLQSQASGDVQGGSNTDHHRVYSNISMLSFQSEKKINMLIHMSMFKSLDSC